MLKTSTHTSKIKMKQVKNSREERELILKEMESSVKEWLDSLEFTYITNEQSSVPGSEKVDFLVVNPKPLVIELIYISDNFYRTIKSQTKRNLSRRFSIAKSYGNETPVIAITNVKINLEELSDIDYIYDSFISLDEIKDNLNEINLYSLNQGFQVFLDKLKDWQKELVLTPQDELESLFSKGLSLQDLFQYEPAFPDETIAEKIRLNLLEIVKKIDANNEIEYIQKDNKIKLFNIQKNSKITSKIKPKTGQEIEKILNQKILQKFQGKFERLKPNTDSPGYLFKNKITINSVRVWGVARRRKSCYTSA